MQLSLATLWVHLRLVLYKLASCEGSMGLHVHALTRMQACFTWCGNHVPAMYQAFAAVEPRESGFAEGEFTSSITHAMEMCKHILCTSTCYS